MNKEYLLRKRVSVEAARASREPLALARQLTMLSALAALFLLELATGFFSLPGVSDCLKVFSSLLKLLLAAVVFNAVVFVVALGLLAKME